MPTDPSWPSSDPILPSTINQAALRDGDEQTSEEDRQLVAILDAYLDAIREGSPPSREDLIARHPHLAHQLEACLAGLEFIHQTETAGATAPQMLGDFRLIREIGRGGMGVVYEAEQVSLQRRVAVKVLRFGSVSDPEAVDRFQREAETVARLHHTNIVPIFYVGMEQGVSYYAMEFIDGKSLADVLAESGGPIDADTVIDWGYQVAEALAHAHQRGVIHRDVKPSNLILDGEGCIWLTDFGLAKRLDDVTLSLSGALLGTPRYMSPEQASAARNRLDHRTDLYSLGATLYELLTGQPVYSAETPHQVILQILNQEPTPPRLVQPSLSQDLETILLKCLAKDPRERYGSAQELANDLRAVREGRPIQARRAGMTERAAKWARRHRHNLVLSGGSFLATTAMLLIVLGSMLWYRRQQLVSVNLTTRHPPLGVELRDPEEELLIRQTVPTQQPIQIPAGDYQLQVFGKGRLSETYQAQLERGSEPSFDLDLDESLVSPPIQLERAFRVVAGDQGAMVIQLGESELRCTDMHSGTLRWIISLDRSDQPFLNQHVGWIWPWTQLQRNSIYSGWGAFDLRPLVTSLGADINQDGTTDILLANRHQACLLAISGSDGKVLWVAARGHDLDQPIEQASRRYDQQGVVSGVFGEPKLCPDIDGDEQADLIVLMLDQTSEKEVGRWLECISSKTGETLWRRDLADTWFDSNPGIHLPESFRWFVGSGAASSQIGGNAGADFGGVVKRTLSRLERVGYFHHAPGHAELLRWNANPGQAPRVTVLAGHHVLGFDAATGQPVGDPIDCGLKPGRPPIAADIDGDGADELVLIEHPPGSPTGPSQKPIVRLGVLSLAQGKLLWTRDLEATWPSAAWPVFPIEAPAWPQVADLDHDGNFELLVPNGNSQRTGKQDEAWGELEVLDAASGQVRWRRRLKTMDQQVNRFLTGPDLDADGFAEVFVTTLWSDDFDLYVDAISGRDGSSIWVGRQTLRNGNERVRYRLGQPKWWNGGRDGWPQVVVPIGSDDAVTEPLVRIFSAGTGKLTYRGSNLIEFFCEDADGDRIEDLFALEPASSNALDYGGSLLAFRGQSMERWNRIGKIWSATADLDGDGIGDLIRVEDGGHVYAASSADARSLWHTELAVRHTHQVNVVAARARPNGLLEHGLLEPRGRVDAVLTNVDPPQTTAKTDRSSSWQTGDLNGDGTCDLLVYAKGFATDQAFSPLLALSGKTGRVLWKAEIEVRSMAGLLALDTRDIDQDGHAEVIWVGTSDWTFPKTPSVHIHRKQLQIAIFSGSDGRLRWRQPLTHPYGLTPQTSTAPFELDGGSIALGYGDLNSDGIQEVMVPANRDSATGQLMLQLLVLDGATGQPIWNFPLPAARDSNQALSEVPPSVATDLDGDGQLELIVLTFEATVGKEQASAVIHALEGSDGRIRWQRRYSVPEDCGRLSSSGRSAWLRPRPLVLRGEGQQPRIGLNLWDNPERVVILDRSGQELTDFRLETQRGYHRRQFRIWPCDTNGDGVDELVLPQRDHIMAINPLSPEKSLWQREVTHLWTDEIEGILPASNSNRSVIVVRRTDLPASIYGIDASTGEIVWTEPAPAARRIGNAVLVEAEEHSLLNYPKDDQAPWFFFQHHVVSRVSLATRNHFDNAADEAGSDTATNDRLAAKLGGMDTDPRLLRPLPWMPPEPSRSRLWALCSRGLFYAVALLYLPAWFITRSWQHRRWSLKWLGLLPLITAGWLVAILMQDRGLPAAGLHFKFILATMTLPVLLLLVRGAGLVWQRRWRPILMWLALTCIVAVVLAVIAIAVAQANDRTALREDEQLDWTGWWFIGFHAAYVTACGWLGSRILWSVTRWLRDRFRARRPLPGSANLS